jgi:sigma-B regulation protein RsbU (phosphoserine phosphatase)
VKRVRRIILQKRRAFNRRLGIVRAGLRPSDALPIFEALIFFCLLVLALTTGRSFLISALGAHAHIWVLLSVFSCFGLLQVLINSRVATALDRRFAPEDYDGRRILFDLGQAARAITTIDELFKLAVEQIEAALHVTGVAIFVRDDESSDFVSKMPAAGTDVDASSPDREYMRSTPFVLPKDAFIVKRLRNLSAPLGLEPHEFEAWERSLERSSPKVREARRREIITLRCLESRLLVQVSMRNELIGIISLSARANGRPFSVEDKQLLTAVAGQMAFIIEHANLVGRIVEEERLRRELALATEVQQRLFPECPPENDTLDLSGFCRPAREVGGDYYDFLKLSNGHIGIAIADVAGKGIAAALLMSIIQASLRSQASAQCRFAGFESTLAGLVREMNQLLWTSTSSSSYVTFFYAQFSEATKQLTYVNAGHNPPLLFRGAQLSATLERTIGSIGVGANARGSLALASLQVEGAVHYSDVLISQPAFAEGPLQATHCTKLTAGGIALGLFDQSCYEQETVQLASGDVLLAYTDGVTEALNTAGEEFGERRLQDLLASSVQLSADAIRIRIVENVNRWCEGAPQHDDLTFVVVKVK